MPKPPKGPRLGSGPAHERLLLAGLAADLIRHERIKTTEAKAKRLRPVADRMITLGKNGSVHARRQALSVLRDREIVHKLFAEVAPRYTERMGGYTRILKLGVRKGDAAPMALIEWVEGEAVAVATETETKRRLGGVLRRRGKGEAEPARPARSGRWRPEGEKVAGEAPDEEEAEVPAAAAAPAPATEAEPAPAQEAAAPASEEPAAPPAEEASAPEVAQAPAADEVAEAPAAEAPAAQEPTAEEPAAEEPKAEQ
jgi:large subunit ribosomal protein L17